MEPNPRSQPILECTVRAAGAVQYAFAEIGDLRKSLIAAGRDSPAQSVVRTCDEQGVLAAAAMSEAARGWNPTSFSDWAVLAAPRYFGRVRLASVMARFQKHGVRGMPPTLIPFLSSHSVSSTLSLFFGIHGPTYGVSPTEEHVSEGLLTAITTSLNPDLPGCWVVMTGWDPEPVPDESGESRMPIRGYGVALALGRPSEEGLMRLRLHSGIHPSVLASPFPVGNLVENVTNFAKASWSIPVEGGGMISFERITGALRLAG